MYKTFICKVISGEKSVRYAVSAGNEHEVREVMVRKLGASSQIEEIKEAEGNEGRGLKISAGEIKLLY